MQLKIIKTIYCYAREATRMRGRAPIQKFSVAPDVKTFGCGKPSDVKRAMRTLSLWLFVLLNCVFWFGFVYLCGVVIVLTSVVS